MGYARARVSLLWPIDQASPLLASLVSYVSASALVAGARVGARRPWPLTAGRLNRSCVRRHHVRGWRAEILGSIGVTRIRDNTTAQRASASSVRPMPSAPCTTPGVDDQLTTLDAGEDYSCDFRGSREMPRGSIPDRFRFGSRTPTWQKCDLLRWDYGYRPSGSHGLRPRRWQLRVRLSRVVFGKDLCARSIITALNKFGTSTSSGSPGRQHRCMRCD